MGVKSQFLTFKMFWILSKHNCQAINYELSRQLVKNLFLPENPAHLFRITFIKNQKV